MPLLYSLRLSTHCLAIANQTKPFELSYSEVFLSLCDVLTVVYSKMDACTEPTDSYFDMVIRIDDKVKVRLRVKEMLVSSTHACQTEALGRRSERVGRIE
jgi:hypothetical protein